MWVVDNLTPGEPEDVAPGRFHREVAGSAGVGPVAVELHHQPSCGPEEVHREGPEGNVHFWLGKAVAATEGEEAPLELAAGVIGGRLRI